MPRITAAALALASIAAPVAAQTPPAAGQQQGIDMGVLHVQVILDHLGFSPGVLDGRRGMSLTAAIKGFQESARPAENRGDRSRRRSPRCNPMQAATPTRTLALTQAGARRPVHQSDPAWPKTSRPSCPALGYRIADGEAGGDVPHHAGGADRAQQPETRS